MSALHSGSTSGSKKPHRAGNGAGKLNSSNCVFSVAKRQSPKKKKKSIKSEIEPYLCAMCDYSTESHSDHINHIVFCAAQTQYIQCSLCSERFVKADLDNHVKSVHLTPDFFRRGEDGSYNCIKCSIAVKYFSHFKKHIFTLGHQGLERCGTCKIICSLDEMSDHQKEFHSKELDVYICKICHLELSSKLCLDRHVTTQHEEDPKMKCTLCGTMFKRQDTLKKHLLTHSNIRSHPCTLCKLSFKNKSTLNEHIKNIHSKNRYQCELCYRGFSDKIDWDNHVLTHEGFTFWCMVCGKGFKTHNRREEHYKCHLNTPKQRKTNKEVLKRDNHPSEIGKFDSSMDCKRSSSLQIFKRKTEDLLFSSNCQKPVDGDDSGRCEIGIPNSKENFEGQNAIFVSREKKANVRGNTENKSVWSDRRRRPRSSKNTGNEVSCVDTDKCDSGINFEKETNLVFCQSGDSKLFDNEKCIGVDVSLSGRTTAIKTEKHVDNLPMIDCCGLDVVDHGKAISESAGSENVSDEFCTCSPDDCKLERGSLIGSTNFPYTSSTIPEETLFVDVQNLPGDCDVESLSSLQPDLSVGEGMLIMDVDNLCKVENIDVIDVVAADSYPMELQYYEVQTEGCSAVDVLQHIQLETGSVASACSNDASQDRLPIKKAPTKKKLPKSCQQKTRRTSKSRKYPLAEKKVIMRNICTDDDDFVLPEFVIDEDE